MSLRSRMARLLAEGPQTSAPPEGEAMAYGIGILSSQFDDTEARLGTYRPNDVSLLSMRRVRRHYRVAASADLVALPLMERAAPARGLGPMRSAVRVPDAQPVGGGAKVAMFHYRGYAFATRIGDGAS